MARRRSTRASTGSLTAETADVQNSLAVEPSNTQRSKVRASAGKQPHADREDDSEGAESQEEEAVDDEADVAAADSQGFWEALEIIDETREQYFIRWAGTDERGKPWPPSWEPKSNANAKLIEAWKTEGRQKHKEKKEAEKEARRTKKREAKEQKRAKDLEKQKRARGKKIMKIKQDSPDPQPDFGGDAIEAEDESASRTVSLPSKVNRKRIVPDSEPSSQPHVEAEVHRSKKQKADARPPQAKSQAKQVTFDLEVDSSPLSSLASSGNQSVVPEEVEAASVAEVERDPVDTVAPLVSSAESSSSVIPDSQPAPAKPFVDSSPEPEGQLIPEVQDRSSPAAQPLEVTVSAPSQTRSFPSFDSPGTNHSDLESDVSRGDDDIRIFNDYSQHHDDVEEEEAHAEEEEEAQRENGFETRRGSPTRATAAAVNRMFGPVPVPRAAAFFPSSTQPESSQFDPIEDPDSSPFRATSGQQGQSETSLARTGSPPAPARMIKSRLELVFGPSEGDDHEQHPETPAVLTPFQAELIANAALSYVSPSASVSSNSTRSLSRTGSGSQLLKRQSSRIIAAPIAVAVEAVGAGGSGMAATSAVAQPLLGLSADGELDEEDNDDDDMSPGEFNEDYFASDLLATQAPAAVEFDDVVDYEGAVAGAQFDAINASGAEEPAQTEAVDAGEGGGAPNGGGHYYSSYPSHQPQQQQQMQQQPQQNAYAGYASGPASAGGPGYGGSESGGQGGGYPYPGHFQGSSSHAHGHALKREYEDERDEGAKRARMEQQQQQQYYHQQQQAQQYAQQQYAQPPAYAYQQQSHGYASGHYPHAYSQPQPQPQYSPPPQQQNAHHYHGYQQHPYQQQLAPMQTSPPPPPQSDHSLSSSQLAPIQSALSSSEHAHSGQTRTAPAPTVSVAAASPPRARSPAVPSQPAQPSTGGQHLTSPSIARVQNAEAFANAGSSTSAASANRSPSPLPAQTSSTQTAAARTSSPAPSLEGVNDLIELVRASSQIEGSDGTKEEIVRFLRNPRGYGDGPLSRADFWAFELRRQMLDAGERVDFIILYTRDGTFKLKRSPTTTIPVEFARSLNHAPDRVRGQTPAVDAVLTLQASSSAPSPLSVSAMTREQLEQEVTSLRAQVSNASTELAKLRPLAEESAKLRTEVQALTQSNKQLKNSRDSAQQDMAYIQEQYSIASTAASARAQEAAVAETEAARLQGLLDAGLKQKAAFYEAGVARWKLEVARMKKEVDFVRAERRKMNEQGIREKAGKWDEVVARKRVKEIKEQERKARIAAGEPEPEQDAEDLDSDEETVSSLLLGDRPKSTTPPATSPQDSIVKLVPDPGPSQETSSAPSSSAVSAPSLETGYRCEWRGETQLDSQAQPTTTTCGLLLPTQQALLEHVNTHVPLS